MIFDGPEAAPVTILLAHGAGAPMDSPSMTAAARALASVGFRVARFEFGYMAARRSGRRKPPPRAETLNPEYLAAIDALASDGPLVIGGKSMGGRVASMIADDAYRSHRIAGLLCLGYPFHPPAKPTQLRTRHLAHLETPTLVVQGSTDLQVSMEDAARLAASRPGVALVRIDGMNHVLKRAPPASPPVATAIANGDPVTPRLGRP